MSVPMIKPRIRVVTVPAGTPYVIDRDGSRPRPASCGDDYCLTDSCDITFRTGTPRELLLGPAGYREVLGKTISSRFAHWA